MANKAARFGMVAVGGILAIFVLAILLRSGVPSVREPSLREDRPSERDDASAPKDSPTRVRGAQSTKRSTEDALAEREELRAEQRAQLRSRPPGKAPSVPRSQLPKEQLDKFRKMALDTARFPSDRIQAWKTLQSEEALTPDVTASIIHLLQTSTEDRVRARIAKDFRGDTSEVVKLELIKLLEIDNSPRVREEAAITLSLLREDLNVREALKRAQVADSSAAVRAVAQQALFTPRK